MAIVLSAQTFGFPLDQKMTIAGLLKRTTTFGVPEALTVVCFPLWLRAGTSAGFEGWFVLALLSGLMRTTALFEPSIG